MSASRRISGVGPTATDVHQHHAHLGSRAMQRSITRSNSEPSIHHIGTEARASIVATFYRGASTSTSASDPTSSSHRSNSSVEPHHLSPRYGSLSRSPLTPLEYQYTFPWLPYHKVILFPQTLSAIPQQSQSSSRQESDPSQSSQSNATPYLLSSPPRQASVSTAISSTEAPETLEPPPFPVHFTQQLTAVPLQTPATSAECLHDGRARMSPPASPKQLHRVDARIVPTRTSSAKVPNPDIDQPQQRRRTLRDPRTAHFALDPVSPISSLGRNSPVSPLSPLSPMSPVSMRFPQPPSPHTTPRKPLSAQITQSNRNSLDRPLPPLPRTVAFKSQQELIRDRILERARANAVARYRELSGSQIRRGSRPSYRRFYGTDHQSLRDPVVLTSRFIKETSVNIPRAGSFSHPALRKTSSASSQPLPFTQRSQRSWHSSSRGGSGSTRGNSNSTRGGSWSTRGGSRSTRGGSSSTDSSRRGPHHIVYRAPHEPETIWERYVNRRRGILEREALEANRYSGSTHWTWRDSHVPYSPTMDPIPDNKERPSTINSSDRTLSEADNGRSQEARSRELQDAQNTALPPLPSRHQGEKSNVADLERSVGAEDSSEDPDKDPNILDWDGPDDADNPLNWTSASKIATTTALCAMTMIIGFASTIYSAGWDKISEEYSVSPEVSALGTAMFILGFMPGPPIWCMLSEAYGRRAPLFFGYIVFALFSIGAATSPALAGVAICRLFEGFFGSAVLTLAGLVLTDIYFSPGHDTAGGLLVGGAVLGATAGPIVGGFIAHSDPSWRWTEYLTTILAMTSFAICWFFIPETYAPSLLSNRAQKIRYETKNWAIRAKCDETPIKVAPLVRRHLVLPIKMFFGESILILVTLHAGLVVGTLYLLLEAFPQAYQLQRGWTAGMTGLAFIPVALGVITGWLIIWLLTRRRRSIGEAPNDTQLLPEARLPGMIVGGGLLPIGLFIFAWTSDPAIHWAPQILSGLLIGAGLVMVLIQGFNYATDCFPDMVGSALTASSGIVALIGTVFALVAIPMYQGLGVAWASSTMAFLSLGLLSIPIILLVLGPRLRGGSKPPRPT